MKALTRLIQTTRRFSASSVCMRSEGVWQQKGVPGKVRCHIAWHWLVYQVYEIASSTSNRNERQGQRLRLRRRRHMASAAKCFVHENYVSCHQD